ncbi:hypothetical protein KC992_04970 [Candidatus Saccharibacteria bacterium]|nr:hypothetical protein [Candidatus Saccharibacteria bacterium]
MNLKIPKLFNLDQESADMLEELDKHYGTHNQSELVRRLIKERYKSVFKERNNK